MFVSVFLVGTGCRRCAGLRELFTLAKGKEMRHSQGKGGLVSFGAKVLGILVDSEIDLSTRNDNTGFPVPSRCFLLPAQI
jgi:hypothetical protein